MLYTCEHPPGPGNHSPTVLRATSLIIGLEKFVLLDNDRYLTAKEMSSICGTQKLITVAAKSLVDALLQYCSVFYFVRTGNCIRPSPCTYVFGFLPLFLDVSHLKFNIRFLFALCRRCYTNFGQLSL